MPIAPLTRNPDTASRVAAAAAVVLLSVTLAVSSAAAQSVPDFAGTWAGGVEAMLPSETEACVFDLVAEVSQAGASLSGTVNLQLVSGPTACPPQVAGQVSAEVTSDGCLHQGQLLLGVFGGGIIGGCFDELAGGLAGKFGMDSGPFADTVGTWFADAQRPAIPAGSPASLLALAALLAAGGALLLRAR